MSTKYRRIEPKYQRRSSNHYCRTTVLDEKKKHSDKSSSFTPVCMWQFIRWRFVIGSTVCVWLALGGEQQKIKGGFTNLRGWISRVRESCTDPITHRSNQETGTPRLYMSRSESKPGHLQLNQLQRSAASHHIFFRNKSCSTPGSSLNNSYC